MPSKQIVVEAEWDPDAAVYVAESADVPGLITEATDRATLSAKLEIMIPELLAANGMQLPDQLTFKIVFKTIETALMRA